MYAGSIPTLASNHPSRVVLRCLAEDLWDSIAADQNALPVTPDQKAELDRRLNAYAVDKNPGRLASEVIAEIRRRL
ncbi:MAG: addiction module protein [Steroidobacteraceae bacterium]